MRHVSHLTGKSNVTTRVHASGVTSNTVKKKRGNRAQKPRFSEAANTKRVFTTPNHTTVTRSRYTVANSPQTSIIPITQCLALPFPQVQECSYHTFAYPPHMPGTFESARSSEGASGSRSCTIDRLSQKQRSVIHTASHAL